MHAFNIIARNLPADTSRLKIVECDTICAITGEKIKEGLKLKDITGTNFTEYQFIKYASDYVSIDAGKCLKETLTSPEGKKSSLRNYSYYADSKEFCILKKDNVLPILLNPPLLPFVIAYSYKNKKHTSIYAVANFRDDNIIIATDQYGNIVLDMSVIKSYLPIIQFWYSHNPEIHKSGSVIEAYFTKQEILEGSGNLKKIKAYGFDKFYEENEILNKFRNTLSFQLIVRLINIQEL